ncbi:serine hydrolase [Pseudanabaena biceps]|nr:serine hydrolase [Pseudanabaena biceps]
MTNTNETVPRASATDAKSRLLRSPEPTFESRRDFENKVRPLPNRQGRIEADPNNFAKPIANLDGKPRKKISSPQRPAIKPNSKKPLGWQIVRLAIAGIGLSVIAGTAISFWQNQQSLRAKPEIAQITAAETEAKNNQDIVPLELKTEANSLVSQIKELAAKDKDLAMQMMVVDLDSGAFAQIGSNQPIAAASTIKAPVLIAFFQDVDAGKIKLDEQLELSEDVLVGESGDFQGLPVGTKISALETATQMIMISDNTATNMIIKRLGGLTVLNQRFKSWGLTNIVMNNKLPDLEGTNTISTQDMVSLLSMIDKGKLITPRSRDRFMDIMRRPVTNTLLPKGIGDDARIIHKTGDIRSAVGDAGIVDMPNGKRYAIAVMVKRPDNDQRANELIRQISRLTYDYFLKGGSLPASRSENAPENIDKNVNRNNVTPSSSPTPSPSGNSNGGSSVIENISIPLPNATSPNVPTTNPSNLQNSLTMPEITRQTP